MNLFSFPFFKLVKSGKRRRKKDCERNRKIKMKSRRGVMNRTKKKKKEAVGK